MFINILKALTFILLNFLKLIFLFFCISGNLIEAQVLVKGKVLEGDSITGMPFVYIINKSNGNGTMSDNEGRFSLNTGETDTLICSYVGFAKLYVPVKKILVNGSSDVKLIMTQMPINLGGITITTFKFKPYERDYMNDIIERSQIKRLDYVGSPVTALYMRYSKEGKQVRKLAKIFEDIITEEQVQKKLSREILTRLTGDDNIDYMAFRKYCYYVNDYYILTHDGVELYSKVMDCYKHYKEEGRTKPQELKLRPRETGD